jgi:MFS family permease
MSGPAAIAVARTRLNMVMTPNSSHDEPDPRRWRALWILCLAQVMLLLDVTVVNVALPPIQHDLGFSATNLAWVVNGYTVTYGGLLMLGGRMGDLLGRRRMFLIGLAVFALSSASAGLAQQPGLLVASRFVQGTGAALVSATPLAPRLLPRFGLRTLNGGGLALSAVGYILLAGLTAHGTYAGDVLPGLILVPLGGGLVLVGSTVAGVDGATGQDAGIATAMNNASMQIGSAIGLAALVSLGTSHAAALSRAGLDPLAAAAHGYAVSFAVAAGVTGFGALLGFFGIRPIAARPAGPKAGEAREPVETRG